MMRVRDWVNDQVRSTAATHSVVVDGRDIGTVVLPDAQVYPGALGLPDPLARRIARNTPNLLVEESHIAAVVDPAGGSGYVESLTEAMTYEVTAKTTLDDVAPEERLPLKAMVSDLRLNFVEQSKRG